MENEKIMNENQESDQKKKRWKNILIALLVILLFLLGWRLLYFQNQNDICHQMNEKAIMENIGNIDYAARQEEVNRIVEESRIRMRINGVITIKNGESDNLYFQNMPDNDFPIVASIILNDETIYESGEITPGKQVVNGKINTDLSSGEYKAIVRYTRTDKGTYSQMEVMLNVL